MIPACRTSKAALLTADTESQRFTPLASFGFDSTTERRLRLPPDTVTILTEAELVYGAALAPYEPFFSIREFSVLDRLLLIPVRHERRTEELILCAYDETQPESSSEYDRSLLASLSPMLSHPVLRRAPAEAMPSSVGDSRREMTRILGLAAQRDQRVFLIKLDLRRVLAMLEPPSPTLDRYCYRGSILSLLRAVAPGSDHALLHDDRLVLAVATKSLSDPNLILTHLDSVLGDLFAGFETIRSAVLELSTYPDGSVTTDDFLNHFL